MNWVQLKVAMSLYFSKSQLVTYCTGWISYEQACMNELMNELMNEKVTGKVRISQPLFQGNITRYLTFSCWNWQVA